MDADSVYMCRTDIVQPLHLDNQPEIHSNIYHSQYSWDVHVAMPIC